MKFRKSSIQSSTQLELAKSPKARLKEKNAERERHRGWPLDFEIHEEVMVGEEGDKRIAQRRRYSEVQMKMKCKM